MFCFVLFPVYNTNFPTFKRLL